MNKRQIVLSLVALDFFALTAFVVVKHGYIGFFAELLSSWPGILATTDLTIALVLISIWMLIDARKHGLSVLPYLVVTLLTGSLGPLAYLIRREWAIRH